MRTTWVRAALACGLVVFACDGPTEPPIPPAPTLATLSPAAGARGTTVSVALTGDHFIEALNVLVSGAGVTVGAITVANPTSLTADFVIDPLAATGDREVAVRTLGGISVPKTFTVRLAAPTLTVITPNVGVRGRTSAVTLTGTDFVPGGTTVAVSGSGITVSGVTVTSSTTLTANFAVATDAAIGDRTVTVTTVSGTSGTRTFTVNPQTPTLSSVSPSSGVQGTTVSVTLTGTHFLTGATTVAVSGADVTVSNVNVVSTTSLTADFAISSSAALGARTVTVTTSGGTSGTESFTVNPPPPTLSAISPTAGVQGTTVAVTLTGTNFITGATTVAVSGSNVTVSNVSVSSGTSLTADFAIASGAALGDRNVTVTTAGGTTAARTFTINPPPPTLTGISPTSGVQGNTVSVTLTGTNFVAGATVAVSGSNVTVNNVTVVSATSITADFVIGGAATAGARTVTVTTSGGTSGTQTFTINAAADPQEVPVQPSRLPLTPG